MLILTSRAVETLKELVGVQSAKPLSQNVREALGGGGGILAADGEFVWHPQNAETKRKRPANDRLFL